MRLAYLDCFSGISGDMFLGALVDAGVPFELLAETVRALNVGAELQQTRVTRNGIAATKIDVLIDGVPDMPREQFHAQKHVHPDGTTHSHPGGLQSHEHVSAASSLPHAPQPEHSHEHDQEHDHEHPQEHAHEHGEEGHAHNSHAHDHRGLKEIREIINKATLTEKARWTALRAFELLGRAEARIHNRELETVHFHEVGSVDAIVDIVCGAVGADWLGVSEWRCSALNTGSGTVVCAHGTLPVPAPATLELLKDAPVYASGPKKELVTPTGAAIVRALAHSFEPLPAARIVSSGYGAGARDFAGHANVLRLTLAETVEQEAARQGNLVLVMEANLDDSTPEVIGYALERMLASGALDAFVTPVQMKKSRPGHLLTVLARPEDERKLAEILFTETSTLGLRTHVEQRKVLEREWLTVRSEWGPLKIKIGRMNGEIVNAAPEYEDCRAVASTAGVSLKQVMLEAMRLFAEQQETAPSHGNQNHG